MRRLVFARWIARCATVAILLVVGIALYFRQEAVGFVQAYEQAFKLVGLAIGPVLAILGFFWGLVDKAELRFLARQLGQAEALAQSKIKEADLARAELVGKEARIEKLEGDLTAVSDAGRLWKIRPNMPFRDYRGWKYDPDGAKVVTFALFKGGVGKSHLAANFAAYVSERKQKPVLLIDLDYQGSLSTFVMSAAGAEPRGSAIDALFAPDAGLATLNANSVHLAARPPDTILNQGKGLSRAWLVPADYTLAELESRLLIQRVLNDSAVLDERYRLAHVLLNPDVRRSFSMIILDTPPRMTLGTVNAFVASHAYVVPTILDKISSEAVQPFLEQVEALKADLALDTELAGIVAMMTRQLDRSPQEETYFDQVVKAAKQTLRTDRNLRIEQSVPHKKQITDNDDLGYFLTDADGSKLSDRFYDNVFDELWKRIIRPQESH